jgi:murein DD-endopeptidase MepM/ murein hydrolase activator NlpD
LVLSSGCFAKKLYKYHDEKGVLHFSDQPPPQAEIAVEIRQLKAEKTRHVWLEQSGDKYHPEYSIRNTYHGPIEVAVNFTRRENVLSSPNLPKRFIVQPGVSEKIFEINGVDPYRGWSFTLQYRYMLGNSEAEHDDSVLYLPPFAAGEKFPVSQAFHGAFSHSDAQNQFAVDIVMPVGTPVHAARSGLVMEVENDFVKGGLDRKAYQSRANSIRILHVDGSMAVYAHLQLEKSQVYPGLKVTAGDLIGFSGNTGYSSGPHLHFAVQVNEDMALVSVPFMFKNVNGDKETPVSGTLLSRQKEILYEFEN